MKNQRWVRLCVEVLESRVVPSTVSQPPTEASPYKLWSSTNWSGTALNTTAGAVTAVAGSWTVPAVTDTVPGTAGYSSAWVGIDGFLSSTVEQLGTESDTLYTSQHDGTPQYYAWYEMYPAGSYQIVGTVQPGDQMTASVVYTGQVPAGRRSVNDTFQLTINDSTEGWSFTTNQNVPNQKIAQRSSAEWVQEAPSGGSVLPLANFTSITFTNPINPIDPMTLKATTNPLYTQEATIAGASGNILSFKNNAAVSNYGTTAAPQRIDLIDIGTTTRQGVWTSIKDETSELSAAGDSFTVQFIPSPPGGSTNQHGGNNHIPDAVDPTFAARPSAPQATNIIIIVVGPSAPDLARAAALSNPFLTSDTIRPERSIVAPSTTLTQTTPQYAVSPAPGFGVSADDDIQMNAGFDDFVPGESSLAPHSRSADLLAGDAPERTPTSMAVGTSVREMPRADVGVQVSATVATTDDPYLLEGSVDRSVAALIFVAVAAHGWNQAATTEEESVQTRREAKKRLPVLQV